MTGVVMYVFVMLLGFYILLRAFDFKVWMAALGAVLWAFSFLLLYYNRCRAYLESHGFSLHSAHDSRFGVMLPW